MALVKIDGYLCERCGYRWTSRNGTGLRDKKDPRVCAKCKSPYWNKPRKNKRSRDQRANAWIPQDEGSTAPE